MHDTQTVAVLVMCALEFEYQLALGLGNSDSSSTASTLAQEITPLAVGRYRGCWLSQSVLIAYMILLGA